MLYIHVNFRCVRALELVSVRSLLYRIISKKKERDRACVRRKKKEDVP